MNDVAVLTIIEIPLIPSYLPFANDNSGCVDMKYETVARRRSCFHHSDALLGLRLYDVRGIKWM